MKEYNKADTADFFVNRSANYEKSPPDYIWDNIEKHIPVYDIPVKGNYTIRYIIAGISLSAILAFILLYSYFPFAGNENRNGIAFDAKSLINVSKLNLAGNTAGITVESANNAPVINSGEKTTGTNVIPNNSTSVKSNTPEKDITYSISASGLGVVSSINFVNDSNRTVISVKNPAPNKFGFYIIDISSLPRGTYNVMINSGTASRLHKREVF